MEASYSELVIIAYMHGTVLQINRHRIQSELVSGQFLVNLSETTWNSDINDAYGAVNAKPLSFRLQVAETLVVK